MQEKYITELQKIIRKENILINEPMKKHTSFKIGGPADIFIKAKTTEEIKNTIKFAKENQIPMHIVGNGSNLLVKDEGIRGIVLKSELKKLEIVSKDDGVEVTCGSGVLLGMLAQALLKESITGFEFAAGIPGTIGGAIRMNAGAHGGEMKDIVISTTYIDMEGHTHTISNKEHHFEYRKSIFVKKDYIILETTLKLKYGNKEKIKNTMDEHTAWRKEKQPLNYPSAGSTFKRGEGFITAMLIDECGLKGYKIGGAQVSEKHAGFIVNTGDATCKDVLDLINYVKNTVYEKCDKTIELELEVI